MLRITFQPSGLEARIAPGASVMDAAQAAGLLGGALPAPCAGQGICGRCQVRILSGSLQGREGIADSQILHLACAAFPSSDLIVELPSPQQWPQTVMPARLAETVFQPALEAIAWQLTPPDALNNLNDADRLLNALPPADGQAPLLAPRLLPALPGFLRNHNWQGLAWRLRPENRIVDLSADSKLLLAVDVGTTSLWLQLIDGQSGKLLTEISGLNPQLGEDIISRMLAAARPGGQDLQKHLVVEAINRLSRQMLDELALPPAALGLISLAGNTVMTQLLLGIDCRPLRQAPYVPALRQYPLLETAAHGLAFDAPALIMPCVGAYVGGDIVAGVLASGLDQAEALTLLIDLGTNGEVVLGSREWMISAAASAGPAFEGGGISCGMAYGAGAVYDVRFQEKQPLLSVAGNQPPRGICGSGLVALAANLLLEGIMLPDGRLNPAMPGIRNGEEGPEYVLSAYYNLLITQADLQNLLRAKAAVYAACACLLAAVDMELAAVEKIILAGSFGNSLNLQHAVTIGLLPELTAVSYAGNSSLAGARAVMLDYNLRQRAERISQSMTCLELANQPDYMEHYTAAMFFPHTQGQNLFPETWRKISRRTKP